jgi:hypothetical protein
MKFIPVTVPHEKKYVPKAKPPGVTIRSGVFTLNNRAIILLSEIYGGIGFTLQLYLSECENYIAFSPKKPMQEITGISKSVSSSPTYNKISRPPFNAIHVELERQGELLVGKLFPDTDLSL